MAEVNGLARDRLPKPRQSIAGGTSGVIGGLLPDRFGAQNQCKRPFVQTWLVGSYPVFNMGYAVAAGFGGHKLVESTLVAGFAGLSADLAGARIPIIQGEAVIRPDGLASQAAARVIYAATPEPTTDSDSGETAGSRLTDNLDSSARASI